MKQDEGFAPLESQMGDAPCMVQDTPRMFYLRSQDDYESRVSLGNALSSQYRFKEAISAYRAALRIRTDDPLLYMRLGGALLTLGQFPEAEESYAMALQKRKTEKELAYYMGIWNYLQGRYGVAAEWFWKGLPADGEMKITLLYWHSLSRIRDGKEADLLMEYDPKEDVGHHAAYKLAVSVLAGETAFQEVYEKLEGESDELNIVIASYGLCYADGGSMQQKDHLMKRLFACESVWPCVAYLAAYHDKYQCTGRKYSFSES